MTTKMDLITFYAERNGIKDFYEAEKKIDKFIAVLKKALSENEKVIFKNFGSFEVRSTKERYITVPKNLTTVHAIPRRYIKFKVSRTMEEELCIGE